MNRTTPTLQPGPAATAAYRLWSGEPVVDYPAGQDWLDVPLQAARQLSLLRDEMLLVTFLTPGAWSARRNIAGLRRRLHEDNQFGAIYQPTPGVPDRRFTSGPWADEYSRHARLSNLRDARLEVAAVDDTRQGWREARVVVLHPRLSDVAARSACYRPRAGQVLVPDTWPHLGDHGLATAGNNWGELPVELILAGAPG